MIAAQLVADNSFHVFMLIATILFVIGAVLAVLERGFIMALVCAGLACTALAWIVVS